jgi:tetratricopeptide (TPR) repeat protein
MKKIAFFVFVLLVLSACAKTSGFDPSVDDTYMISRSEKSFDTTALGIKADTLKESLQWYEKSYQNVVKQQWAEAIRTSSAAIAINPNLAPAYVNRAWAYIETGLFNKAIEDCNKAIELEKNNAAAFNNRGLAYSKLGEDKEAIMNYRRACEMGVDVACDNFKEKVGYFPSEEMNFLLNKSVEGLSAGNYGLVIDFSTNALEIEQNNEHFLSIRCDAKANLGLFDEAEKDCLQAIKINPDFFMAYNNYGFVLEKKGAGMLAIIYYEISCRLGSNLGCENNKRLLDN